jgi:hypothetical protein
MILETLRAWTDWLGNVTHGVNALLPGVERDGGDPAPPNVALIVDETRDPAAARRQIPDTVPCLIVRLAAPATMDDSVGPNTPHRDGDVPVMTLYAAAHSESDTGNQDVAYTLRAVERSLAKFLDYGLAAANTARQRNNISILHATALQQLTTFEPIEDRDILGGLAITFHVRDKAP